jgi:hypothetical protein
MAILSKRHEHETVSGFAAARSLRRFPRYRPQRRGLDRGQRRTGALQCQPMTPYAEPL